MRKIIAALHTSLDGFIEDRDGQLDWVEHGDDETWQEVNEMLDGVDTHVLGRGMYPAYEQYWMDILANPSKGSKHEAAFARRADKTPHVVVSRTLDKVAWKAARIVRDLDEIRKMKQQSGKNIYVVGGATLVSNLMNAGLVDEVRLQVNPVILGAGKSAFKDVSERHTLKLLRAKPMKTGKVSLTYGVQP